MSNILTLRLVIEVESMVLNSVNYSRACLLEGGDGRICLVASVLLPGSSPISLSYGWFQTRGEIMDYEAFVGVDARCRWDPLLITIISACSVAVSNVTISFLC